MFGWRYARAAFVEAIFDFRGDSERKDDAGAGNEGVRPENALTSLRCTSSSASSSSLRCTSSSASSSCPCCRRVATTTFFFGEGICLSSIGLSMSLQHPRAIGCFLLPRLDQSLAAVLVLAMYANPVQLGTLGSGLYLRRNLLYLSSPLSICLLTLSMLWPGWRVATPTARDVRSRTASDRVARLPPSTSAIQSLMGALGARPTAKAPLAPQVTTY
jgi:hypothetical protein